MSLLKKCVAECIGTFVLVFFGCGTAVALGCTNKPDPAYFMTAVAFGLVIVAMAYSIGNVSGCHINPAVSIGVLVSGKMTVSEFFAYIASQFIGGILGGAALKAMFPNSQGLGTNGLFENNIWASLLIEIILTFVFVLAIIYPYLWHLLHRNISQPCKKLRSCYLRRRRGFHQCMGIHSCSAGRRRTCSSCI